MKNISFSKFDRLPKPLSTEEEQSLLEKVKLGDEDARELLIETNLRLVIYVVNKFQNEDEEELFSVGSIGLIKAVDSFDNGKNVKFATYASRCILNEILMYIRKGYKEKQNLFLEDVISSDKDGNEMTLGDILSVETQEKTALEKIIQGLDEAALAKVLNKMKKTDRDIIIMHFGVGQECGRGKTQKEIADFFNLSQSYISRKQRQILLDMKKDIEKLQA